MAKRERHPTDRKSIAYGTWFFVSSVICTVIVAVWSYLIQTRFPDSAANIPPFLSLFGTWGMLLYGLAYILFGRSKRLRIRHPGLIAPHFYGASAALVMLVYLEAVGVPGNTKPPTMVEAVFIALYLLVGGMFLVNVWRSLQSKPSSSAVDPLRRPPQN